MGQAGKKPENQRRNKDDKWVWSASAHPVIIPYFDERGELIKLRPHKGGAPGGTIAGIPRIYVPRDFRKARATPGGLVEIFPKVLISEGEFKGGPIWVGLGPGRELWNKNPNLLKPIWGAVTLPGIQMAKNYDLRCALDAWLGKVQCREVVVAFDAQDKSGKPARERIDVSVWAGYLVADIQRKLRIKASRLTLPKSWQDENKKADIDGALRLVKDGKL
jgi:hypothetical protein